MKRQQPDGEDDFPRGRPAGAVEPPPGDAANGAGEQGAQPKGDKTRRKRARTADGQAKAKEEDEALALEAAPGGTLHPQHISQVQRLRIGDLSQGSLVLAAVREVSDEEITLNLPFNVVGHVCKAQATEALFAEDPAASTLAELFKPGRIVVAVVLGIVDKGDVRQHRIDLSLRPSLLNAGLTLETVAPQMSLPAVVEGEEEHVLRLSFGVDGLSGLLKKSDAAAAGIALKPGVVLQVVVQAVNAGSKTLRCTVKAEKPMGSEGLPIDALKAGFLVRCRVDGVLSSRSSGDANAGLVVTYCSLLTGVIHVHHQSQGLAAPPEFKRKQLVTARVIAVVPGSQVIVHLSLLPHLVDWSAGDAEELLSCSPGDRVEAEVSDVVPKLGVRLTYSAQGKTLSCFCPAARLADKEGGADAAEAAAKELKELKAGSKVECRVLGYNFFEGALVVTRRPYDLKSSTLVSVTELELGQLVVGEIARITEFGVFVQLSEYISGLVNLRQLTDVPLASVSKKHAVGSTLKCRVLKINPQKRQVDLTAKKSLVRDTFQLTRFDQARKNMIVTGFVNRIKDYGAIVAFYGDMHGLIPKKEMEMDEAPAVGMAVRCRIATLSQKRQRLGLSVNLQNGQAPAELMAEDQSGPDATLGDLVAETQAVSLVEEGVFVIFKSKRSGLEAKAFVPIGHLSDSVDQAKLRYAALAKQLPKGGANAAAERAVPLGEGVVLARRFHPNKSAGNAEENSNLAWGALVSLKPSLRLTAEDGAFVNDVSQLQESRLYTGYVKQLSDFGAIISVGGWKVAGVAPRHQLADHFVEKPAEELALGQTVRALVGKIDGEKQRFLVDLRPVAATSSDAPLLRREAEALRLYFEAQRTLAPGKAPPASLCPGTVLAAKVVATKPYGLLLSLDDHAGFTALALKENMPAAVAEATHNVGASFQVVVLDVDTEAKIVDVSLQPELLAAPSPAAVSLMGKKKRKRLAKDVPGSEEVHVLPALQKPAYSVLWSKDPPAVYFAPPFQKNRWTSPLATIVHRSPECAGEADVWERLLARCPIGAAAEQRAQRERTRVPKYLKPSEELCVGAPVTMKIQHVKGLQVLCSAPVGIRGHIHATQLMDELPELGSSASMLEEFGQKKTIEARILRMQQHGESQRGAKVWHLELTCRPCMMEAKETPDYEAANVRWGPLLKRGKRFQAAICEVRKQFLWVELSATVKGKVDLLDATENLSALKAPHEHFQVGQVFNAQVLRAVAKTNMLDLAFVGDITGPARLGKTIAKLVKIEEVKGRGVAASFMLPGRRRGFVHVTELFDFWAQFPVRRLKQGTFYEVSVLRGDVKDEEALGGEEGGDGFTAELSLRPSLVHNQAEATNEKRPLKASDLTVGQKVCGYVVNSGEKGVFVALSRCLVARIRLRCLSDQVVLKETVAQLHPVGELIQDAVIVEIDAENGRVELSLRKGGGASGQEGKLTVEQLSVGDVVSGRVKAIAKYGLFVRLDNSVVDILVHHSELSDSASMGLDSFKIGTVIPRAKVLELKGKKVWASIKPSNFDDAGEDEDDDEDIEDLLAAARADSDSDDGAAPGAGAGAEGEEEAASGKDAPGPKKKANKAKAAKAAATAAATAAAAADSDDEVPWARGAAAAGVSEAANVEAAFRFSELAGEEDEKAEGDEMEDEEAEGDVDGRPSKRQKKALKLTEQKDIQKREADHADGEWARDPGSSEDFERLLLTQGDTSIIWIRYMAFHLKMSDLERARQVAERAVKHVGFAEARERFNVWVAFMNLECTFGTEQTAEAVYKRAASHNDAKQVSLQLAKIHERNKKPVLATKIYEVCCRKFGHSKKVWLALLGFLYNEGDLEGARKTLPRMLAALPRRKHPLVVSKAALFEYQQGSAERGRSIFEGLLDSYPKRTDLWSVYIDAHMKAYTPPKVARPDFAEVRGLMERCCAMRLKPVKMRFFFKRWLEFEKRCGDSASEELVRSKARDFVERQAS